MRSARLRRTPAWLAGLAVALIAAVALSLAHGPLRATMPRATAVRDALRNSGVRSALAGTRWNRVTVSPVDQRIERVSFYAGERIAAEVSLDRRGRPLELGAFAHQRFPYGNPIAYQPGVLIGLSLLFALVSAVVPLRRVRNLDVAAALTLLAPVVLLQEHYVGPSALAALPGLGYLLVRCAWRALGHAPAAAPATPLLHALTPGCDARRRLALLRLLLLAVGLVLAMVGLSSTGPLDVVFAVMEGATKMIHGVLPYGHLGGDVIHGDTYPLLSYVLYVPLAWLTPVNSVWDSVDLGLAAAVAAALAAAVLLYRVTAGPRGPRTLEDRERGMCAALAWLAFPPLLITVSSGTTDVALAAMVLGAIAAWRRPAVAGALLALGGWLKLAPLVLMPLRLSSLPARRAALALAAAAAASAPLVVLLLILGGPGAPAAMVRALSFQFSRGSPQSLWAALGLSALQPAGQAAVLGLIASSAVRLRRDPILADDPARIAALSASVLIGLQLAADYWAVLYAVWVVPLLCLSLYRLPEPGPQPEPVPLGAARLGLRGAWAR